MKKIIGGLCGLLLSFCALGQKQTDNWYFGYGAALNFSSGSPVVVTGSAMNTGEGSAAISDNAGNLLFYTNGIQVWDKTNTQMPNGFGLMGNSSSTESGVVVPMPGSPNLYYVFAVAAQVGIVYSGGSSGLSYSIVDMTLNGGLGDINSTKNVILLDSTDEKIAAVRHCNGKDVWVITHRWNTSSYYAYLITAAGIQPPVITTIGPLHNDLSGGQHFESIGYLKASYNGKKLVAADWIYAKNVEIYDFDNSAGVLSNAILDSNYPSSNTDYGPYGAAFSPDNSKLYVACFPSDVFQYDMNAGSAAAIIASKTLIISNPSANFGAISLASNGKLYVANTGSTFLDVINTPNAAGAACNYVSGGFPLTFFTSSLGLPAFIESFLYNPNFLGKDTTICTSALTLDAGSGWGKYQWSTGDTTQKINVTASGAYWVKVLSNASSCGPNIDTINVTIVKPSAYSLGNDTTVCASSYLLKSNLSGTYTWSTGATTANITVSTSGKYWVKVLAGGCTYIDTINIALKTKPVVNLGPDLSLCSDSQTLDAGNPGLNYKWSTGASTQTIDVTSSGTYAVKVSDAFCSGVDTVKVNFKVTDVNLGNDTMICPPPYTLNAGNAGAKFLWSTGDTVQVISVNKSGKYWVAVTNSGCTKADTVNVTVGLKDVASKIPNVFTPNNDGKNDLFDISALNMKDLTMEIYDRWGIKMYDTSDPKKGWDGKHGSSEAADGTYFWIIKYKSDCGGDDSYVEKGHVTLLR